MDEVTRLGLLDEVLDAHGGLERWSAATEIKARVRSGGVLPRTRTPGNRLADYELSVQLDRPHVVLDPFPEAGRRGVFEASATRIESDSGSPVESREDPRAAFFGWSGLRRNLRWDALDTTYFAGYAMWNYLSFPYLLVRDGVEVREGSERQAGGQRWRSLEATFPAGLPTHSREQTFWIDEAGLLRRHDYTAEVVSRFGAAAHVCDEHREADGLTFPTRRRVVPRGLGGRALPGPTLVSLELDEIRVT